MIWSYLKDIYARQVKILLNIYHAVVFKNSW